MGISGSLALLADAGHMLTDVAGLTLALVAAMLAGGRPPGPDLGIPGGRLLLGGLPLGGLPLGGCW